MWVVIKSLLFLGAYVPIIAPKRKTNAGGCVSVGMVPGTKQNR